VPSYRQWVSGFRDLGLGAQSHLLVHASLESFAPEAGGTQALLGALLAASERIVAPAFTRRTLVTPPTGPAHNGMTYGDSAANFDAEIFRPDLPVDPELGSFAEALRRHPEAARSTHPALSFCGIRAEEALATQSLDDPLAPIRWLAEADADILLLGATHRRNVSLHFAERLAGRKSFLRWALTESGIVACPGFPGCPDGFEAIEARLEGVARRASVGGKVITSIPLRDLIHVASGWIREDPRALLCGREGCLRCAEVRAAVRAPAEPA
jgi:aminoglycoside 3-N-acetyltransferase